MFQAISALIGAAVILATSAAASESALPEKQSSDNTVSFEAEVQDLIVNFDTFFATVLPGEILNIQILGRPSQHDIAFETDVTVGVLSDNLKLSWKAPAEPGLYPIIIRDNENDEAMTINVFVLQPAKNIVDGKLNGYRIGAYPEKPLRGDSAYQNPLGFIEVTPALKDTKLSPNFTVSQFFCKQKSDVDVKYVVLRPALLLKLERVVSWLQAKGIDTDSLFIMSGYRTPFYNKAIGNVRYSRHVYGDAADVYVDYKPRDGDMDDINNDGAVNRKDAAHLFDLIDEFDRTNVHLTVQGGLGEYDRNAAHGPFVHIDVRGAPARWGR